MNERILVVDDEPSIRDVVERYLSRSNLRREGYDTLSAADADLIVLDLMLPKLDGGRWVLCTR